MTILDSSIQTTNRSEQLVYSTYFGGSYGDVPYSLKQDSSGNIYITGFTTSPDMTVTANALDATYDYSLDAFVLIFNPSQTAPIFSTFLASGGGVQIATALDLDNKGHVYVTGYTSGGIFDQFNGAVNPKENGQSSAFVLGFQLATAGTAQVRAHHAER